MAAKGCCCCRLAHLPRSLSASPRKVTGVGSQNEFLTFPKGMWENRLTRTRYTAEQPEVRGETSPPLPVCCRLFRINKVKTGRRVGNSGKIQKDSRNPETVYNPPLWESSSFSVPHSYFTLTASQSTQEVNVRI